jgi:hypothetical protein
MPLAFTGSHPNYSFDSGDTATVSPDAHFRIRHPSFSPDGSWKIGVSEDAIHFARPASGEVSFTPDSHGWRAKAGWFVFIESESRVWAYDGDRQLYLDI